MTLVPTLAEQPSAIVQAAVCEVMLTLPHDQDFGRAERYVELWSKAFGQVTSETEHREDFILLVPTASLILCNRVGVTCL